MNEAKKRFLDLKVEEISLVDTPANEKEFAVIKRLQEDDEMAVKIKKEKVKKADAEEEIEDSEEEETEGVEVEVEEPDNEEIKKALNKVTEMVSSLVSKASEKEAPAKETTKETTEKKEENTSNNTPEEESVDTDEDEEKTEKKKENSDDEILSSLEKTISKAKRFTPGRMKTLKSVVESLQTLVEELAPHLKQESSPNVSTGTIESGITKALETMTSTIKKNFEDVFKSNKELSDRVEKIEKTRKPSASIEEDGGTENETEVKKGFWEGTL